MLPTAGLYLRETLHRKETATTEQTGTRNANRKYFEKKPKIFERKSLDRKPAPRSQDDANNSFQSLSTVFNFIDFVISQNEVSSENKVFVNLIHRVRHDVNEATRLRSCPPVMVYCESVPNREAWIDAVLLDVKRALNDIGVYVENVRVSGDDGGGGVAVLKRKFEWVLGHHQKLLTREISLSMCHQSLMAAISVMQQIELGRSQGSFELEGTIPDAYEEPIRPWLEGNDAGNILRSPHSRQKWRSSQRNLSLPSIMVSESKGDIFETLSINETPVELPGSTPDDLPDPENWDLYAPPLKSYQSIDKIRTQRSFDDLQPRTSVYLNHPKTPNVQSQLRRSFDRARPRASSYQAPPKTSPEKIQSQASIDQIRPRPSIEEYRSRTSFDQIGPLPLLKEKPVGRTDSAASISKAATIPLAAIRHRPKAVNVRKPPTKHCSLPSETQLPYIPTQSSLIMELSRWVLPNTQEGGGLINALDTPSKSGTSLPIVPSSPRSYPEVVRPVVSVKSITTVSTSDIPPAKINIVSSSNTASPLQYSAQNVPTDPPLEALRTDGKTDDIATTIPSPTGSDARKSPPSSMRSGHSIPRKSAPSEVSLEEVAASQAKSPVVLALEWATGVKPHTSFPLSTVDSNAGPIMESETAGIVPTNTTAANVLAEGVDESLSNAPSINTPTKSSSPSQTVVERAVNIDEAVPISPAMNAPIPTIPTTSSPTGSVPVASGPKPMVAQSKRRAAHARRMQLAYGSEQ